MAHIGLLGLVFVCFRGCIVLKNDEQRGSLYFQVIVVIFTFLALEEIVTKYSGSRFLSNYISGILPLDLFPFIFTLIIGQKLARDIYQKTELEIELAKSELHRKSLEIDVLEKKVLKKKLDFKSQDLTYF